MPNSHLTSPGSSVDLDEPCLRIGELARRTGVAAATLRIWQRRYAFPDPARTPSGYRLFTRRDVELVQRVQRFIDDGVSAREATRLVQEHDHAHASTALDHARVLEPALRFDGASVMGELDRVLVTHPASQVMREVALPMLHDLGDGWANGTVNVSQEHFASNLLRGRLWGLVRGWDRGEGERAVLAAAPGDQHELGLLMFGIALREHGWRITYLGADTPIGEVARTAELLDARAVVVSLGRRMRLGDGARTALRDIANADGARTLAIGGPGATAHIAESLGAVLLDGDPISAAAHGCFAHG